MPSESQYLQYVQQSRLIDFATFEQILEMDDDEHEREFSRSIVFDFFDQASSTFEKMGTALAAKDFIQLKELGHFLKGSSATLGLRYVRDNCEKIQNYGDGKDETGTFPEPDRDLLLQKLKISIEDAKVETSKVEKVLKKFYGED